MYFFKSNGLHLNKIVFIFKDTNRPFGRNQWKYSVGSRHLDLCDNREAACELRFLPGNIPRLPPLDFSSSHPVFLTSELLLRTLTDSPLPKIFLVSKPMCPAWIFCSWLHGLLTFCQTLPSIPVGSHHSNSLEYHLTSLHFFSSSKIT